MPTYLPCDVCGQSVYCVGDVTRCVHATDNGCIAALKHRVDELKKSLETYRSENVRHWQARAAEAGIITVDCGATVEKRFFEPCDSCIACLRATVAKLTSALMSVGIERDHHKETVKAITHSGLAVNTAERGLKDMTGEDVEF